MEAAAAAAEEESKTRYTQSCGPLNNPLLPSADPLASSTRNIMKSGQPRGFEWPNGRERASERERERERAYARLRE